MHVDYVLSFYPTQNPLFWPPGLSVPLGEYFLKFNYLSTFPLANSCTVLFLQVILTDSSKKIGEIQQFRKPKFRLPGEGENEPGKK